MKILFFGLLKHYKNRGFSNFLCFLLLKEKKTGKKMITGIYEFGFFWSKSGRFVTHICFPTKKGLKPLFFIVLLGCALFGPSCQKREILDTPPKRRKFSLITEKLIFEYFCFFLVLSRFLFFSFLLFLFCCFLCFFLEELRVM